MRTLFIDVASILTVFDIVAPEGGNFQAKFNEEHLIRYAAISVSRPYCALCFASTKIVADVYLKESGPVQVHNKTPLRRQLKVDEVRMPYVGPLRREGSLSLLLL